MASSQAVYIKSGDQPRAMLFGNAQVNSPFTTTNQNTLPIYKESVFSSFQVTLTGTGALTGTVAFQISNDDATGRGFVFNNRAAPGAPVGITSGTTAMTSAANDFVQGIVGTVIDMQGVPSGTTVVSVTNAGVLVMSAVATATVVNAPANFRVLAWCATALATVTLSGSTLVSDGFTTTAPWRYVRAVVTNVTGTGATLSVNMGV